MALWEWRLLCFIIYSGLHASFAQVVQPRGYVTTNNDKLVPSGAGYEYKFYEGEKALFTCHKNVGSLIQLVYTTTDDSFVLNSTSVVDASSVSIDLNLRADSDHTVLKCKIGGPPVDIRVWLILDAKRGVSATWIIVFGAVVFLVLAALGLWIWVSYNNRLSKNNSSNMVNYTERNSIENLDPRVNDQHCEPTHRAAPHCKPAHATAPHCEPTHAFAPHCEPTNTSAQYCEPTRASATHCEPTHTSAPYCEPTHTST